jgi:hypothetical protein
MYVTVERKPDDFTLENCAEIRWHDMRYPSDTMEAVQQRLAELGYYRAASGGPAAAIAAFQRDRGLPATGEVDAVTRATLFPDGRWPNDTVSDNDIACARSIVSGEFGRRSDALRDGAPQPLMNCPPGWTWTDNRCDQAPPKPSGIVPPLFVPTPPSCPNTMLRNAQGQCQCGKGTSWDGHRCRSIVTPPKCPQGYVGTPPNCKQMEAPF